jgi:hypothetical protein
MIPTFNDEMFDLDANLSDFGLQVFRPIIGMNDIFGQLVSPLPPLTGVAEPFSIENSSLHPSEPSSMETISIETIPIGSITLTAYPFVDPLPVHNCPEVTSDPLWSNSNFLNSLLLFSQFLWHLSSGSQYM